MRICYCRRRRVGLGYRRIAHRGRPGRLFYRTQRAGRARCGRKTAFISKEFQDDRIIRPHIVMDPSSTPAADLVLVIVKSYDTRAAVKTVREAISPDGLVLTLQNGIGNFETLNQAFPGRVLLGTTTVGAMTLGPGTFQAHGLRPDPFRRRPTVGFSTGREWWLGFWRKWTPALYMLWRMQWVAYGPNLSSTQP